MDVWDVDALAERVLEMLAEAEPATVIVLRENGELAVREPGQWEAASIDRGRRPIATFVASHLPPPPGEVARRIRVGLRKRELDGTS